MTEQELSEVLDLVSLDAKKFNKMIENETVGNLQMRLHSLIAHRNKLPQQGLETPEDRMRKKAKLDQLITALQWEINKKVTGQSKTQVESDKRWVEKSLVEQLPNLRYSSEDAIRRMANTGTMEVPIDVPQWHRLTSTTVEARCESGKTRKLDLKKLHPQALKNLLETPFRPMFFVLEGEGMVNKEGAHVNYWSNQKDYSEVTAQRQVQKTVLALMWVG